ncbi:MAG: hypothetical protein KFH87_10100 [Bacteroidetes bacterium]|nr:hypothetical protein [Bacteroidota bacterium]
MKHITLLFAFALLFVAYSGDAFAQNQRGGDDAKTALGKQNLDNRGPRFIDEDGDGICDHKADGTAGQRQHARIGARDGSGPGTGQGSGDGGQRKRLRDGSCGDGAAPGGVTPAQPMPRGRAK